MSKVRWVHVLCFALLLTFPSRCLASDLREWGDVFVIAVPGVALGSAYFAEEDLTGLKQAALVIAGNQVVTSGLKAIVRKERPNRGDHASFPSGHASATFAGAGFVHFRYGFKWAAPLYAAAVVTAYSRVASKRHYWEDVIAGAAIGMAMNFLITTRYTPPKSVAVAPMAVDEGLGVTITYRFN